MRIRFKLLLLIYRCVQQTAPAYMCELIHPKKKSKYGIRSKSLDHLHVLDFDTKSYADCASRVGGPTAWNKLPLEIRQATSVDIKKSKLKTLFFFGPHGPFCKGKPCHRLGECKDSGKRTGRSSTRHKRSDIYPEITKLEQIWGEIPPIPFIWQPLWGSRTYLEEEWEQRLQKLAQYNHQLAVIHLLQYCVLTNQFWRSHLVYDEKLTYNILLSEFQIPLW